MGNYRIGGLAVALLLAVLLSACSKNGGISSGANPESGWETAASQAQGDETSSMQKAISQDAALALLVAYNAEELGLPAPISTYTIVFDDMTTEIDGKSYQGLSAFADLGERMENMGVFFVAQDGSRLLRIDSLTGDYVEIAHGVTQQTSMTGSFDLPALHPDTDAPASVVNAAMTVYSWFRLGTIERDMDHFVSMPYDETGSEITWYKVLDESLDTYEEMRGYLCAFFSGQIADELLSAGVCKTGEDGYLYFPGGSREPDALVDSVTYDIIELTDTSARYECAVGYKPEAGRQTQILEYVCAYDGERWVFTQFPYFF